MNHKTAGCNCPCLSPAPDPAFEFVDRFNVGVPKIGTSAGNVPLLLAQDTHFVERLPGACFDVQCWLRELGLHGTRCGDRKVFSDPGHVQDRSTGHLFLEPLVG